MREVLSKEREEYGAEQWDPDAWEEEVIRFTPNPPKDTDGRREDSGMGVR